MIPPSERDDKYLEIITLLNQKRLLGFDGLFDCGSLGIIRVFWGGQRWENRWYKGLETIESLRKTHGGKIGLMGKRGELQDA